MVPTLSQPSPQSLTPSKNPTFLKQLYNYSLASYPPIGYPKSQDPTHSLSLCQVFLFPIVGSKCVCLSFLPLCLCLDFCHQYSHTVNRFMFIIVISEYYQPKAHQNIILMLLVLCIPFSDPSYLYTATHTSTYPHSSFNVNHCSLITQYNYNFLRHTEQ